MAKNLIFLDIETSGLYPEQGHCILGIGAIVVKNVKKNPESEFSIAITPTRDQWALAAPEALKVNGFTYDYLVENGKPFAEAKTDFIRWLVEHGVTEGKYTYVGQNPSFDLKFLGAYMGKELDFIGFPLDDIVDNRDLYSILVNRRTMPYLKYRSGKNISLALGVPPEPDVHDALEGARVVRRNYEAMMALGLKAE